MTAIGDESYIALGSAVVGNSLSVFKNGLLQPPYTFANPKKVLLPALATAGDVYVVEYTGVANVATAASLAGGWNPSGLFAASERGGWWDPSDITTLWQDSVATTPVTAVGDPVGRMDDKSGNGNHFIQANNTSFRPIYQVDGSGYPYLQFTAANTSYLYVASGLALAPRTASMMVVTAHKHDSTPTYGYIYNYAVWGGGNTSGYQVGRDTGTSIALYNDGSTLLNTFSDTALTARVIQALFDRTPGVQAISQKLNGVLSGTSSGGIDSTATDQNTAQVTMLGGIPNGAGTNVQTSPSSLFDGRVYGVLVRLAATSATLNTKAQTWMGNQIGLSI
jgi:hypothetical protein